MAENKKVEKTQKSSDSSPLPPLVTPRTAKRAAAIKYEPGEDDAPVLAAFGEGLIADKIIEVARESGVPVLPDPSLASMLSKISVGDEIPEELYEAVARVLVFVSELDRSYGDKVRRMVN